MRSETRQSIVLHTIRCIVSDPRESDFHRPPWNLILWDRLCHGGGTPPAPQGPPGVATAVRVVLNLQKCAYGAAKMEFLGHTVDSQGVR